MDTSPAEGKAPPPPNDPPLSVAQVLAQWAPLIDTVKDTTGPLPSDPAASCIRDLAQALAHADRESTLRLQACSIYHYLFEVLAEAVETGNVALAKTITQDMLRNGHAELPPFGLDRDGKVQASGWAFAILAQAMHDFMDALPAPNSAEWQLRYGDRVLVVSAQWKHGKTPMDCRREALAEVDRVTRDNILLRQHLHRLLTFACRMNMEADARPNEGSDAAFRECCADATRALQSAFAPNEAPANAPPTVEQENLRLRHHLDALLTHAHRVYVETQVRTGGWSDEAFRACCADAERVLHPMLQTTAPASRASATELRDALAWLVDAMLQWATDEGGDAMHDDARPTYAAARAAVDDARACDAHARAGLLPPTPRLSFDHRALVTDCVRAMNAWAQDTDGVHPVAWEAYKHARALLGDPIRVRSRAEADVIVDALVAGLPPLYRTPSRVDARHGLYTLHFPRGVWINIAKGLGDSDPHHHAVCVSTELRDELADPDPVYFVQGTTPHDPYPADGLRNLISIEGAIAYLTQRLTEEVPALPLAPVG